MNDLTVPTMALVANAKLAPYRLPSSGATVVMTIAVAHAGKTLFLKLAQDDAQGSNLYTSPGLPLGASDHPIKLRIPRQLFLDHVDKRLKVFYEVSGVGDSPAVSFEVEEGFAGEHTVDLDQQVFTPVYSNGEIRLPKQLPAFLSYERPALGATGYQSSDPSVATVDAQGKVTVLRNGQSVITAQLPAGPQSYTLNVKGIRGFEILSKKAVSWEKAKAQCAKFRMALPGRQDFNRIVSLYGADLTPVLATSSTPLWGAFMGADTAWTLNPVTLVVTSESTQQDNLRQVIGLG